MAGVFESFLGSPSRGERDTPPDLTNTGLPVAYRVARKLRAVKVNGVAAILNGGIARACVRVCPR